MKLHIYLILLTVLLSGCIRTTDIFNDAEKLYQPKLVVYSLLTEGDSIFVNVKHTIKINEQYNIRDIYVKNAKVILKNENGDSIILKCVNIYDSTDTHLFFDTHYSASQESFKILPGKNYYLFVSADGYPSIKSQTKVPNQRDTFLYVSLNPYTKEDSINSIFSFNLKWKYNSEYSQLIGNPENLYDNYYFNENMIFDNVNETVTIEKYFADDTIIYLNTINNNIISYFMYKNLTQQSMETSIINRYNGVIPEFNNIEGGYGIFSAYLTYKKSIFQITGFLKI